MCSSDLMIISGYSDNHTYNGSKRSAAYIDEKDFAIRLARLREKKGVSARDMSLSIGQNPGYINNIETGKSKPSLEGLFYICEYLGITPRDFFDDDIHDPSRFGELIGDMKKLNDRQLELIAALVKELIGR